MLAIPILTKCVNLALAAVFVLSLSYNPFNQPNQSKPSNQPDLSIEILAWDGESIYDATINNDPVFIKLESDTESNITKEKQYSKEKTSDGETEEETLTEYSDHIPNPGRVKIVFKNNKSQGITLVYDRNMSDGEISETDKKYLDKVFANIDKFHKENNSISEKLKEFYNNHVKKK